MFFHDILPPSRIPSPPAPYYRNKAHEMRDISKKAMHNVVEEEYNNILTLIRGAAEAGYRDFTTFEIKGDVDELIQKLKNDGFEIENGLNWEYPYLTIKW